MELFIYVFSRDSRLSADVFYLLPDAGSLHIIHLYKMPRSFTNLEDRLIMRRQIDNL